MKILEYLFLIGICFTIFEFIWAILKFIFNAITNALNFSVNQNVLRITKYLVFISVNVHFIQVINTNQAIISSNAVSIGVGTLVLGLYLLGKYQTRITFSQFRGLTSQFIKGANAPFDPKLEKFLILGGLGLFILGSLFPMAFNNSITQWFTDAILNIYDTPFFGFVFKVIALFILIGTFSRGGRIIGKLINGASFEEATASKNNLFQNFRTENFNRPFSNQNTVNEPEFTEYEDVTDEPTKEH